MPKARCKNLPLFVYGTLMSDNNPLLLDGAVERTALGVLSGYELRRNEEYPVIVPSSSDSCVFGEIVWLLLSCYKNLLLDIDGYEGNDYKRTKVCALSVEERVAVRCWTYVASSPGDAATLPKVAGGRWSSSSVRHLKISRPNARKV